MREMKVITILYMRGPDIVLDIIFKCYAAAADCRSTRRI